MDKNGGPNHLQAWRRYRKLTQEKLADLAGTTKTMISMLETGDRGLSARWLRKLAPLLDTTPGLLLDLDPTYMSDLLEQMFSGLLQSMPDVDQDELPRELAKLLPTGLALLQRPLHLEPTAEAAAASAQPVVPRVEHRARARASRT